MGANRPPYAQMSPIYERMCNSASTGDRIKVSTEQRRCHSICQSSMLLFVDVTFWGASLKITIERRNGYF